MRQRVTFMIEDTAKAVTLQFDVGYDPDGAPPREWAEVDAQL